MKLSFSTNGWELSFEKLLDLLYENKITGLEIHDINAKCFSDEKPFDFNNAEKTKKLKITDYQEILKELQVSRTLMNTALQEFDDAYTEYASVEEE